MQLLENNLLYDVNCDWRFSQRFKVKSPILHSQ